MRSEQLSCPGAEGGKVENLAFVEDDRGGDAFSPLWIGHAYDGALGDRMMLA